MSSVLVVANPKAKLFRREPKLIDKLYRTTQGTTRFAAPDDVEGLRAELKSAAAEGVEVIAIAGGDGTAAFVLTELWSVLAPGARCPRIALLRGGTMNTVALGLGLTRGKPHDRLEALIAEDAKHTTRPCALLRANGRLGFLFGTGVFASFLEAYYDAGRGMPGPDTAVSVLGRFVGSSIVGGPFASRVARRIPMELTIDGKPWDSGEYLAVAAGTVPDVGLGFRPFPRTRDHHDAFELVGLRASPRRVATILPSVMAGRPLSSDIAATLLGRQITLHSHTPFNFMVDGDIYPPVTRLDLDVAATIDIVQIAGIDTPNARTV